MALRRESERGLLCGEGKSDPRGEARGLAGALMNKEYEMKVFTSEEQLAAIKSAYAVAKKISGV